MPNSPLALNPDIINGLVVSLHESTTQWVSAIQQFPDNLFNSTFENKWSAGQILMHIILTERSINNVLTGPSKTIKRAHTEKYTHIETLLANRTRAIKSPANLEPRMMMYGKTELLRKFADNRSQLLALLESEDLGNEFVSFVHPFFGELSGVEWVHFVVHHATRHLVQLDELKESLQQTSNV